MSYGIQVFSKDRTLQVDEKYYNLYLLRKVSFVMVATGTSTSNYLSGAVTYSASSISNMIAFRCDTVGVQVLVFKGSNNDYYLTTSAPCNLTIYEFGEIIDAPSNSSYGLKVWRVDGTISFDSTKLPLRVISSLTYDIDQNGNSSGTQPIDVSIPTGRIYATCIAQMTTNFVGIAGPIGPGGQRIYYYRCGTPGSILINSSTLRTVGALAYNYQGSTQAGIYNYGKGTVNGFVIDVTDY